ncbi:MAG: TolC family protein, partial [Crocinitomicaceae bacterium]
MILSLTTIFSQQTLQKNDTLIISLSDVWLKADEHSREIEIAKKEVDIRNEEILDTKLEVLPELAINGSAERATNIPIYNNGLFHTPTQHEIIHNIYRVSGDFFLNIYNGNRLNLKIKETKVLYQLSTIQRDQTIANVRYESAKLYLELQKSYVFLHLVEKDIKDQEKQVEEIRAFNKNGVSLKNDVFRIELDLSRRKLLLLQIQNDILIANQKLNIIMGEPDDLKLIPEELFNPDINHLPSYEECLQIAEQHSFQYHISEQKTELSKINLSQVKANYRPQVALTGEFYYSNPQIFLFPYNPYWYSLG